MHRIVKEAKDHQMMLDWNEYRQQLGTAIGEMAKISPETIRGYRQLSQAGEKPATWTPKLAS